MSNESSAWPRDAAHQRAIDAGHCCGVDGAELRCKVCRWSSVCVLRGETRRWLLRPDDALMAEGR